MRNKPIIVLPFIVCLLFTAHDACSQGFSKLSLIGISAPYNLRKGTFDFGDSRSEDIGKPPLFSFGVVLGKRWRLSEFLRLQICANIYYGSVVDDTIPEQLFTDRQYHKTATVAKFLYGGCVVDFQYPLALAPGGAWFLHGGGGAHCIDMGESMKTLDKPMMYVDDPYLESQIAFSTSVQGGIGAEMVVSPRFGVCLDYSLRYWFPVHYKVSKDLFPVDPVHYHERFLSHELGVLLLVKRR